LEIKENRKILIEKEHLFFKKQTKLSMINVD
jgi:hypothetical protein